MHVSQYEVKTRRLFPITPHFVCDVTGSKRSLLLHLNVNMTIKYNSEQQVNFDFKKSYNNVLINDKLNDIPVK